MSLEVRIGTVTVFAQVTEAEGRPVDRSRAWCQSLSVPFFRFSPPLSREVALDETDDEKLVSMIWETECYMRVNAAADVAALVDFLRATLAVSH